MRKAILILSSLFVLATNAFAQETFFPGFQWSVKGGAGVTVGETNDIFGKLISPAAAIDLGYQFSPLFTLRADISGWQGKGVAPSSTVGKPYNWTVNYVQLAVDGKFDIINMFTKQYKHRVVNPYLLAGLGGQYRFNNKATKEMLPAENLLDQFRTISYVGRLGAGVDFRLTPALAIVLEFVENATDDTFNSKKGDIFDHQMDLLLGLNFSFGQAKKQKAAAEAAAAAAAAAAAQAAAVKAAADKALADARAYGQKALDYANKNLAENSDEYTPENIAAINDAKKALEQAMQGDDPQAIYSAADALTAAVDKANADVAAAKKAAEEKAAAEAAAAAAAREQAIADAVDAAKLADNNIYYLIGKTDIRRNQQYKIARLVKQLNANPDATVTVCGYADKNTGTPDVNMVLSENRATSVAEALIAAGIAPERIKTYWFGDEQQVSKVAERNRVSVMISK